MQLLTLTLEPEESLQNQQNMASYDRENSYKHVLLSFINNDENQSTRMSWLVNQLCHSYVFYSSSLQLH